MYLLRLATDLLHSDNGGIIVSLIVSIPVLFATNINADV
jgi:hypothetical protein